MVAYISNLSTRDVEPGRFEGNYLKSKNKADTTKWKINLKISKSPVVIKF